MKFNVESTANGEFSFDLGKALSLFSTGADCILGGYERIQSTINEKNKVTTDNSVRLMQQKENAEKEKNRFEEEKLRYEQELKIATSKAEYRREVLTTIKSMIDFLKENRKYLDIPSELYVENAELRKDYATFTDQLNTTIKELTQMLTGLIIDINKTVT